MIRTRELPLPLQLVMETDGTVTDLVRRLFQEDICVVKLSERIVADVDAVDDADAEDPEQRLLLRRIFLQGQSSGKPRVYAESKIWLDRLPQTFSRGLTDHAIPIGTLWREHRLETFKEIISRSEEVATAENFGDDRLLFTRTYRVYNQQQVIMEITEKFPVDDYQQLGAV